MPTATATAKTVSTEDKRAKLVKIMANFRAYARCFLKIKTKDSEIVPFILNAPQEKLLKVIEEQIAKKKPVRIIILKARQMGFSTLTEGIIFHRTTTMRNVKSLIVAHKDDSSTSLFNMSKLFYEMLPDGLRPPKKASNAKELLFENPTKSYYEKRKNPGLRSQIRIATAGGEGIARGETFVNVHLSELAWWTGDPKVTLTGIMQAVPNTEGSLVIIESTANGMNYFQQLWEDAVKGNSDFIPFFCAWYELPEYRMPVNDFGRKCWQEYKKTGSIEALKDLNLTADELMLIETYGLDLEQIKWRRWCIKNNCGNDENIFKQEYPSCPEEAFLTTGTPVFNRETVIIRKREIERNKIKPIIGDITYDYDFDRQLIVDDSIEFRESDNGQLRVYEMPVKGRPYVIGGDIAEGGTNFSALQVLDNITGKQVAVWHGHIDTDLYAKVAYCLGKFYNTALIAIEANYDKHPVKELVRLGYYFQYLREILDTAGTQYQDKYGFITDGITRPVIIANLVSIVRENSKIINDIPTLDEMLTFVRNKNGKPEAEAGKFDDLVMALAIAYQARGQQSMAVVEEEIPKTEKEKMVEKLLNGGNSNAASEIRRRMLYS